MVALLLLLSCLSLGAASAPRDDFPCPLAEDINPCICTVAHENEVTMDCSNVAGSDDLKRVFQSYFPFHLYHTLTITKPESEPRVPITDIDETTFNRVSFVNIEIVHTDLVNIADLTFNASFSRIETYNITDNSIHYFPFDEITVSPMLREVKLSKNDLTHMSNINSISLEYLDVSQNENLFFFDQAFHQAPNLKYINFRDVNLSHIHPNAFINQIQLETLDLSYNKLSILHTSALKLSSPVLTSVNLDYNPVQTTEANFFVGITPITDVWFTNTSLTDLPQAAWEPVFSNSSGSTGRIHIINNPLECGCNLKWLVTNPTYNKSLDVSSNCIDGFPIIEMDVEFIQNNC